jgi:hypothetical protein
MGTILEAIEAGCVPITTRESGVDDRVLEHCVVVEPGQPDQHRQKITEVLAWTETEFRDRQAALADRMASLHTWRGFDERVRRVVWNDH